MSTFYNDLQSWSAKVISFSTNQDNILIDSSVVFFNPSVDNLEISGFDSERLISSTMLWGKNRTNFNIILKNNSANSSVGNKISIEGGSDYIIGPQSQVFLLYDDSKWNLFYTPPIDTTLPLTGILYFGDPSTDDSWRIRVDAGSLVREKRIAGVWTLVASDSV